MNPKLIKSVLRNKVKSWARAVENDGRPDIAELILKETVIMGGSICSMLSGERPNDYDVYFRTNKGAYKIINYYTERFKKIRDEKENKSRKQGEQYIHVPIHIEHVADPKGFKVYIKSAGVVDDRTDKAYQYFETHPQEQVEEFFGTDDENEAAGAELKIPEDQIASAAVATSAKQAEPDQPSYRPVYVTQNAITLSDNVQIVTRFYGEPGDILDYYDYEHCKMWYRVEDGFLKLGEKPLECLLNKRLEYTGSRYPICSLFRMRKFMSRGWHINAGQIVKMAWQIHQLDLTDPLVLEEQLIGVDHAYFVEILAELNKKREQDGDKSIDGTYLISLIDKYF